MNAKSPKALMNPTENRVAPHPERSERSRLVQRRKRSFAALRMTEAGASVAGGAAPASANAVGASTYPPHSPLPHFPTSFPTRGGSVYTLVMGLAMLVTVVGAGMLAATRLGARSASNTNDWDEAGVLAYSAVQQAISSINAAGAASPSTWRSNYASGATAFTGSLGRGTMSWVLKDETDGNLAADYARPIRLYGVGAVGKTKRCYSVLLYPAGAPLDVLRTAYHAGAGLNIPGGTTSVALNGPASSNGKLTVAGGGTVNGSVECVGSAIAGGGTVNGTLNSAAATKPLPSTSIFTTYQANATALPWYAALFGSLSPGLLSGGTSGYVPPAYNISPDPNGLYYLQLPNYSSVSLTAGRYNCTLLIDAAPGNTSQTLILQNEILWQPWRADYPILIVRGVKTVRFQGSLKPLNESASASPTVNMNLNLPGTPYNGVANSTQSDSYPSELDGLIHIIGATTVYLDDKTYIKGTVVTDGTIVTTGASAVSADPALLANPPRFYVKGDQVTPVPGTWKWEALP